LQVLLEMQEHLAEQVLVDQLALVLLADNQV
jgi:hypothetical protein